MSTLYPTELGPLDPGARWTVEETKHKNCEKCLALATTAGELFNEPANSEHWSNGAAEADFSETDPHLSVYHYALVRRERAQPWKWRKSPTAWDLSLYDRIETPLDAGIPDRSLVYVDSSGDYNVHTEHGWQVVESGEMVVLFSPRNGRGGFDSQVIHQDGQNGPWRVLDDEDEAAKARATVTSFNIAHSKAWARRAKKEQQT